MKKYLLLLLAAFALVACHDDKEFDFSAMTIDEVACTMEGLDWLLNQPQTIDNEALLAVLESGKIQIKGWPFYYYYYNDAWCQPYPTLGDKPIGMRPLNMHFIGANQYKVTIDKPGMEWMEEDVYYEFDYNPQTAVLRTWPLDHPNEIAEAQIVYCYNGVVIIDGLLANQRAYITEAQQNLKRGRWVCDMKVE